jgi:hypothetical protein
MVKEAFSNSAAHFGNKPRPKSEPSGIQPKNGTPADHFDKWRVGNGDAAWAPNSFRTATAIGLG